jgi:uncharacterized protein (DUF486 family)
MLFQAFGYYGELQFHSFPLLIITYINCSQFKYCYQPINKLLSTFTLNIRCMQNM